MATDQAFTGSVPATYDRFLGPMLFEAYAADMAERVAELAPKTILETAAGTGIATRAVAARLPEARMTLRQQPREPRASQYYTVERRLDSTPDDAWSKFLPGLILVDASPST